MNQGHSDLDQGSEDVVFHIIEIQICDITWRNKDNKGNKFEPNNKFLKLKSGLVDSQIKWK